MAKRFLCLCCWLSLVIVAHAESLRVTLTVTTDLKYANVPMDPVIDFAALIRQAKAKGVFDPNSVEVWNVATKRKVAHATSDDFAYGDKGRIEFVVRDPNHRKFEIRFSTTGRRPTRSPPSYVPPIGVGDLLRFNAGHPRPITLFFSMGLHDLTGDGHADLVGTWNYAYRPGEPWDGVICYPRVGKVSKFEFGDLRRLRFRATEKTNSLSHFTSIYMAACFADFNRDGHVDLVVTRIGQNLARFYLNTKKRDHGGMPIFRPAGAVSVVGWKAVRAVDLNGDGAVDLVVEGNYVKNGNSKGWPFKQTKPTKLNAGRSACFLDVDRDGRLDAVDAHGGKALQPDFYRFAWRRNLGGDPPRFGKPQLIEDIRVPFASAVAAYRSNKEQGLIVQHHAFERVSFFALSSKANQKPRFTRVGRAESLSAVMSLSDQSWPHFCDWDADGDLDLLIGGGYGWPRIVMNTGTRTRPSYSNPKFIHSNGKPIRFLRNQLLGKPANGHDMGYPYPAFVDWDGDGLRDLVCPNETNRIYWFKNKGTTKQPNFGKRRQIICDGYPDSAKLRKLSAQRASDPKSNNSIYPYEKERPFFWRMGAAIADFNGDGLVDLVTGDGHTGVATLFVQYRAKNNTLRLRKEDILKLVDGRKVDYKIVRRRTTWTESYRAVDWDKDGRMDLLHCLAGSHHGIQDGGSMYLLRNVGTKKRPTFAPPKTMRCFGKPIRITNHGPHAWAGDYDGDGNADIVAGVEWSVYPYYSHAALMMKQRPKYVLAGLSSQSSN